MAQQSDAVARIVDLLHAFRERDTPGKSQWRVCLVVTAAEAIADLKKA